MNNNKKTTSGDLSKNSLDPKTMSNSKNLRETSDGTGANKSKTVHVPDEYHPPQPVENQTPLHERIPLGARRIIVPFILLFLLIAIFSIVFKSIAGIFWSKPPLTSGDPTTSVPITPATSPSGVNPSVSPTTTPTNPITASSASSSSPSKCSSDLATKMLKSKVSATQVDRLFYQKYPDRQARPLNGSANDVALRQEWCDIANQEIQRKTH
jgi:hypothetical protein